MLLEEKGRGELGDPSRVLWAAEFREWCPRSQGRLCGRERRQAFALALGICIGMDGISKPVWRWGAEGIPEGGVGAHTHTEAGRANALELLIWVKPGVLISADCVAPAPFSASREGAACPVSPSPSPTSHQPPWHSLH